MIHDHAWAIATDVVRLFAGCLREEEQVDAFREVYDVLAERLEQFLLRRDREAGRLGRECPGGDESKPS